MRAKRSRLPGRAVAAVAAVGLLLTCALLAGCAGNGRGIVDETLGGGIQGAFPPTLAAIQQNVFTPICIDCHFPGGPGPMPLTSADESYDNLVNVLDVCDGQLFRVKPGEPDNSFLIRKLRGGPNLCGSPMPLGDPPLTSEELQPIVDWIRTGARR